MKSVLFYTVSSSVVGVSQVWQLTSPEPTEQSLILGTGDCLDPSDPLDYYQPQTMHILPQDESYGDRIPEPQPRQRRLAFII